MATPGSEKPPADRAGRALGPATSPEVADAAPSVVLVPVGSCEQHGPHLPLDTDTRIAVAVARGAAAGRDDVVVAPAVAYGASGEHQAFAGTLSIGTDALRSLLVELGRSAFPPPGSGLPTPFRAMIVVNGHGGNHEAVRGAVDALVDEGRPVRAWWPTVEDGDAHAGRTETSLLLAIAPDVVRAARPVGNTTPVSDLLPRLRSGGVGAVASDGVLGDATGATREAGERLLRALVADLAARLD